jgi:hypothetical protein
MHLHHCVFTVIIIFHTFFRFDVKLEYRRNDFSNNTICSQRPQRSLKMMLPNFLLTILLLLISTSFSELCSGDGDPQSDRQEILTTGTWWTNEKHIDSERHGWFRYRQPFQPILDSPEQTMIAGAIYTHSEETLKMTVLFPPLHPQESRDATVYLLGTSLAQGSFAQLWEQPCQIQEDTWHCLVRFENIPHSSAYTYSIHYTADKLNQDTFYNYDGSVPIQKDYPRIAGVGCFGPDNTKNKDELQSAIIAQDPDLLVLQGDQTYFHDDVSVSLCF